MFCARCGEQIPDATEICPLCGKEANFHFPPPEPPVQTPSLPVASSVAESVSRRPIDATLKGVGGWLRVFCVVVGILTPLRTAMAGLDMSVSPEKLIAWGITIFSVTVGVMIWAVHPRTIAVLRGYFIFMAALGILGIVGSVLGEHDENTQASLLDSVRTLIFVLVWGAYFWRSERVRANFGRNLF